MLNKQVAQELGLALVTIKVHRGRAMQKLGIKTAADLGRIAGYAGL
jgi:DNA-binding NarL/FixJ family response regulator